MRAHHICWILGGVREVARGDNNGDEDASDSAALAAAAAVDDNARFGCDCRSCAAVAGNALSCAAVAGNAVSKYFATQSSAAADQDDTLIVATRCSSQ